MKTQYPCGLSGKIARKPAWILRHAGSGSPAAWSRALILQVLLADLSRSSIAAALVSSYHRGLSARNSRKQ
jgi:hypothetical protein